MKILSKILRGIGTLIGLGIWYIDYIIFVSLGSIGSWFAQITGAPIFAIKVICWLCGASIMIGIFIIGTTIIFTSLTTDI